MSKKLIMVIAIHHLVIIAMVVCPIIALFTQSLVVSIPLSILSIALGTNSGECVLTRIENKIRKAEGLKPIKGFIKHYYIW